MQVLSTRIMTTLKDNWTNSVILTNALILNIIFIFDLRDIEAVVCIILVLYHSVCVRLFTVPF
jgi:hypothetical protein